MRTKAMLVLALICAVLPAISVADLSDGAHKPDLDVFAVMGQSNAAYTFRCVPSEAPSFSTGRAFYYGTAESPVTYADWEGAENCGIYDMMGTDGARIGGLEAPFAKVYTKATGHSVLMVNIAVSGATILKLSPGQPYYEWGLECLEDAMSKVDRTSFGTIAFKGVLWAQGESNPDFPIEAYQNRYRALVSSIAGDSAEWFDRVDRYSDISLVRQYRGVNANPAQVQLAADNADIVLGCIVCDTFTSENGLLYNDMTHYTQKGRNIVGTQLAEKWIETWGRR